MELWIVLLIVGLAALAAGGMALAVWALLRRTDRKIAAYQNKLLARQIGEIGRAHV